jgi:hypothetical protein
MNGGAGKGIGQYRAHIPYAAVVHDDGNLSAGGLFHYESDRDEHGRTWRPDLVPAILAWLEEIPAGDHGIVQRIAVGRRGSFRADFTPTDRHGRPRDVAIEFDHNKQIIRNDTQQWAAETIVPYARATLDAMARLR